MIPRSEIRLVEAGDGWWSAIDEGTNVPSQGPTRQKALENLDEALELTQEAANEETPSPEPDPPWLDDA